jgi:hypothetical protein
VLKYHVDNFATLNRTAIATFDLVDDRNVHEYNISLKRNIREKTQWMQMFTETEDSKISSE